MPEYEPTKWNKKGTKDLNNCYNYATDNRNEPPAEGSDQKPPHPANPGGTGDISPYKMTGRIRQWTLPDGSVKRFPELSVTCKGLKTAMVAVDKLSDVGATGCAANCWRVAYYYATNRYPYGGDYHLVREDSPGKWSHKTSATGAVTDQKYNSTTGKFDGGRITNPRTDSVGAGYTFCGYVCCCPGTRVAMIEPPMVPDRDEAMVAIYKNRSGWDDSLTSAVSKSSVTSALECLAGRWQDGFGGGAPLYRIDTAGQLTVFVNDESVTVWDRGARHLEDPKGEMAAAVEVLLV